MFVRYTDLDFGGTCLRDYHNATASKADPDPVPNAGVILLGLPSAAPLVARLADATAVLVAVA